MKMLIFTEELDLTRSISNKTATLGFLNVKIPINSRYVVTDGNVKIDINSPSISGTVIVSIEELLKTGTCKVINDDKLKERANISNDQDFMYMWSNE